jgi:hypothetical protein
LVHKDGNFWKVLRRRNKQKKKAMLGNTTNLKSIL